MSIKLSDLTQKLGYYLLDSPELMTEEYKTELATLIGVFRRVSTPTIVKKGNVFEIQDPFPENPDPIRTRLAQLAVARLERTIDIKTYLEYTKEARNEFQGDSPTQ